MANTTRPSMKEPSRVRTQFEDWWDSKRSLYPIEMKWNLWLAFADGWHRRGKYG